MQAKTTKRFLLFFWIGLILLGLGYYVLNIDSFTPEKISSFLKDNETSFLWVYLFISLVRGIFLIPSTPFVFAGIILFPEQPLLVFLISLLGVSFSASFIYFFAQYLEFDHLISKKEKRLYNIKTKINQYGFWIVLVWSFFPIVPTDLICYIASITKMSYWKFISALFIGESLLIALYVWFGDYISGMF